jgi:hypothetical protein
LTPDQAEVVATFENVLNNINKANPKPADKKKITDTQKRLGRLYHQFDKLSVAANTQVIELAKSLKVKDYKSAEDRQTYLISNEWTGNNYWIPGVKGLIMLAKKYIK